MKHLKYLNYIIRHKWYVMIECFRMGLYWRGLVHDVSKFFPSEWIPYTNYFNGNFQKGKNSTGYYKPTDTGDSAFDFAWLLHQKHNRHHWQWWVLPEDSGGIKVLEMQEPFLTEMICDWVGAGKAQGRFSPPEDKYREVRLWWEANKHKMMFGKKTLKTIEDRLYNL